MENAVRHLSIISVLVLTLLFVPSGFDGFMSSMAYILAFVLPFLLGLLWLRADDNGDKEEATPSYITIDKRGLFITLLALFPCVFVTFSLSYLTVSVMSFAGFENTVELGDNLFLALLMHAAMPAVLEELVFRYLPLRFIGKRAVLPCILLSSLFFSLVHHSFFSYFYTFVAGAILITIDLLTDSVIPSMIIHFVNNLLSVLWTFYSGSWEFELPFFLVIAVLAVLSGVAIFLMRGRAREVISDVSWRGERYGYNSSVLFILIPSIAVAILELI